MCNSTFFPCPKDLSSEIRFQILFVFFRQAEWATEHITDHVASRFMSETWPCPVALPSKVAEDELLLPPQPSLNVLSWNQKIKVGGLATLKTPEKVVRQWGNTEQFMTFWQEMKASGHLDAPPASGDKRDTDSGPGRTDGSGEAKKRRVTSEGWTTELPAGVRAAPIAELPGPCICEAPCEKSVYLWSCPGQKVFIVNKGTAPVTLKSGSVLAGWFKGKRQLHKAVSGKEVPEPEEADLLFELTGSSDNVLMGATYMTLGQVIAAKRACAPADAFIGFHEIQDAPTDSDVKAFKAVRGAHALHFRPDTVQMKTDQEIPTVQS